MTGKSKIELSEEQQEEMNGELWDAAMDFMDDLGEIEQKRDKTAGRELDGEIHDDFPSQGGE